jgi:hypothetical protein
MGSSSSSGFRSSQEAGLWRLQRLWVREGVSKKEKF